MSLSGIDSTTVARQAIESDEADARKLGILYVHTLSVQAGRKGHLGACQRESVRVRLDRADAKIAWELAAVLGDVDALRAQLDRGADVNQPCDAFLSKGDTALKLAADFGNPQAVRFLLDRGADPNLRPPHSDA